MKGFGIEFTTALFIMEISRNIVFGRENTRDVDLENKRE